MSRWTDQEVKRWGLDYDEVGERRAEEDAEDKRSGSYYAASQRHRERAEEEHQERDFDAWDADMAADREYGDAW